MGSESEGIRGIIPPMVTPFKEDGSVDLEAFREEVDYLIGLGVHGLAVGGSTGEGHTLTDEEGLALTREAIEVSAGRVPVVAGIIVDSTQQAVKRGKALQGMDVAALQITPVHYLFTPDEEAMYGYYATIAAEVGLPIIIYNVVPWAYATPALLTKMITEIDEVIGVKQSSGDMHALAELMILLGDQGLVMAAVDDLLYPCFSLGSHGAIAAILTAVPELCLTLWNAVQEGRSGDARDAHEKLLRIWLAISAPNLPARVKVAMDLEGRRGGLSRPPMPMPSADEVVGIRNALTEAAVL
jgi:4-hydroxy-tetrahydrodipicolinate synthase